MSPAEVVPGVMIAGAAVVEAWQLAGDGHEVGGYAALAVSVVGSSLCWRWPWTGLSLTVAAPLIATAAGWNPLTIWTIAVIAAFLVTVRGLPGVPAGILVGVGCFVAVGLYQGFGWDNSFAPLAAFAAVAAGTGIRANRRYADDLEQRTREAILTRESEAERLVAEERIRIARDLHDIVGHEVAVVSMHLGAAEVHLPGSAADARADLSAARTGIQSILRETQHILAVLRVGSDQENLTPTASYERIDDLVATFRAAGLTIDGRVTGPPPGGLAPHVSAAAFRVVQEALTNAQRHGTGAVALDVAATDAGVTVDSVNDVAATSQRSERRVRGLGLVGMRERVASTGGLLEVDTADGRFRIRATLVNDVEDEK